MSSLLNVPLRPLSGKVGVGGGRELSPRRKGLEEGGGGLVGEGVWLTVGGGRDLTHTSQG